MTSKSSKHVGVCLATSQSTPFRTAVGTQPLSERERSPKKLVLLYEMNRNTLPTLQLIRNSISYMDITYGGVNCDDSNIGQDDKRYTDRVRPPRR